MSTLEKRIGSGQEAAELKEEKGPYQKFEGGVLGEEGEEDETGKHIFGFCGRNERGELVLPKGVNPKEVKFYVLTVAELEELKFQGKLPQDVKSWWGWKNPTKEFLEEETLWSPGGPTSE